MPIALEVTLITVLVALAIGGVLLLFQLRHTARGVDAFLLASRSHLAQITEDVHASRLRMDHLAASLQVSLDELADFAKVAGEVGTAVKKLHDRFHGTLESVSYNLGSILGGISAVLAFFKSRQPTHEPEPENPA